VLFFATVEAVPVPSLKKHHLRRQVAGEEIARWTGILNGAGLDVTEDDVVAFVMSASKKAVRTRWRIVRPFRRLERRLKMGQAWGLFSYTDNHPGRLIVEGSVDGSRWTVLYPDPQHNDPRLAATLVHRRIRGIWDDAGDRPHPGGLYRRWVDWLGRRVFAEYPELSQVRVHFEQLTVRPPGSSKRVGAPKSMHMEVRSR